MFEGVQTQLNSTQLKLVQWSNLAVHFLTSTYIVLSEK